MFSPKRALLYAFLLAVLLEPILGRKGFSRGHSYPKSGGLSGSHHSGGLSGAGHGFPSHSSSHGYPSGGSLSGSGSSGAHKYPSSGGSHTYPSSGGSHTYPSSGGSHGYPSSGGSHTYPSSGGSHTYPSSGGSHGYPSSGGSHGYPAGGGLSGSGSSNSANKYPSGTSHTYPSNGGSHTYPSSGGSHNYPSSGGGLSGNRNTQSKPVVHHTTHVHNYHYAPPQRISYTPVHGGAPVYYPVYHGQPPTYVYQYKNSGSKYGTLLAGLALLNLGTLAGAAYAHSGHSSGRTTTYTAQPGEVCKFAVKRDNGDYEETKIDCQIISSFIFQDQAQARATGTNTTTSVVTVTNTTVMNTNNMTPQQPQVAGPPVPGNVMYTMLPNGTLVPVNVTGVPSYPVLAGSPVNATQNVGSMAPNGVLTSSVVTTTTTNTTLVNALDVKGKAVEVTPGMQCFVIRNSPIHNMRKNVPCGLLQTYADKSIQRSSAARNVPMFTMVGAILAFCLAY